MLGLVLAITQYYVIRTDLERSNVEFQIASKQ